MLDAYRVELAAGVAAAEAGAAAADLGSVCRVRPGFGYASPGSVVFPRQGVPYVCLEAGPIEDGGLVLLPDAARLRRRYLALKLWLDGGWLRAYAAVPVRWCFVAAGWRLPVPALGLQETVERGEARALRKYFDEMLI